MRRARAQTLESAVVVRVGVLRICSSVCSLDLVKAQRSLRNVNLRFLTFFLFCEWARALWWHATPQRARMCLFPSLVPVSLAFATATPGDLFASLLAPVTQRVNADYPRPQGHHYVPVEVDACRSDPAEQPQSGGCMAQVAMTRLDEIGYLRALYAPSAWTDKEAPCGPAVIAQLNVATGFILDGTAEYILDDYCWPVGVGNASRPTVSEALAMARAALEANHSTMPSWHAINLRMPLDPCVTEASYIFDAGNVTAWESGLVAVGLDSHRVCQTPITAVRSGIPVCQKDRTRFPVCFDDRQRGVST